MEIGKLIKDFREKRNMSQRQFAISCGVSNGYISMLEEGKNPKTKEPIVPSVSTMKKIATAMGMTLNELMDAVDEMDISIIPDLRPIIRKQHSMLNNMSEEEKLWTKITKLDDIDRGKVEAYTDGLLTAQKYQEHTQQIKVAARSGGIREITLTDSQIEAIKNLPEITDLD